MKVNKPLKLKIAKAGAERRVVPIAVYGAGVLTAAGNCAGGRPIG